MQQQSVRRIWIDMAVLQVSILWLAGWAPMNLLLVSLSLMFGVVYLLWGWDLTGPRRHRMGRMLLGASVVVAVGPLLAAPQVDLPTEPLQLLLLLGAGYCAMQTNHIVTA